MKTYDKPQAAIRAIRQHITTHVSESKILLLDEDDIAWEWLCKLKEDTKPSDIYFEKEISSQYSEALKGLRPSKVNQWPDKWNM